MLPDEALEAVHEAAKGSHGTFALQGPGPLSDPRAKVPQRLGELQARLRAGAQLSANSIHDLLYMRERERKREKERERERGRERERERKRERERERERERGYTGVLGTRLSHMYKYYTIVLIKHCVLLFPSQKVVQCNTILP